MHAAALTYLAEALLCRQSSLTCSVVRVKHLGCVRLQPPRDLVGRVLTLGRAARQQRAFVTAAATPASPTPMDVAVIGAGAAGLVAVKELRREGHRVTVFEQSDDIGGVWRYVPETEDDPLGADPNRRRVHSSMYAGLRTNLPREVMGFQDLPFLPLTMRGHSCDGRQFPSHEEVYGYLKAFAATFQLEQHVQFETRVVRAVPVAASLAPAPEEPAQPSDSAGRGSDSVHSGSDGVGSCDIAPSEQRWQVTTARAGSDNCAAGGQTTHIFDALVVCNGHFSEPRLPDAAGSAEFPGRQMHSHNYREAGPFAGRRVVVVGAAASGEDIGREIAQTAAEVYISSKTWAGPGGAPEGRRRNLRRMPAFEGLAPDGSVLFAQEQVVEHVDTVVYATGYVYSFPFLSKANVVAVEDNRVAPLYEHMWPPRLSPRLSFIGLPWKVLPFPQYELQARWVARVLSGRVSLPGPAQMEEHIQAFTEQMEADGIATRFTHRLDGDRQWRYNQMLTDACGPDVSDLPEWCPKLYEEAGQNRKARPGEYRDESLDQQFVEQAHRDAEVSSQSVSVAA